MVLHLSAFRSIFLIVLFFLMVFFPIHSISASDKHKSFWEKRVDIPQKIVSEWISSHPAFDISQDGSLMVASRVGIGKKEHIALFKIAEDGSLIWRKDYNDYSDCEIALKTIPQKGEGSLLFLNFKDKSKSPLLLKIEDNGEIQKKVEIFNIHSNQKSSQTPNSDELLDTIWGRMQTDSNSLFLWSVKLKISSSEVTKIEVEHYLVIDIFDLNLKHLKRDELVKIEGDILDVVLDTSGKNTFYISSVNPTTKTQKIQKLNIKNPSAVETVYEEPIYEMDQSFAIMMADSAWPKTPFFVASFGYEKLLIVDGCRSVRTRLFEKGKCIQQEEFKVHSSNLFEPKKGAVVINNVGVAEAEALMQSEERVDLVVRTLENVFSSKRSYVWMIHKMDQQD